MCDRNIHSLGANATRLRGCTNYARRFSMLNETGFYVPSMAHNALPRRPCRCISGYQGIILQTLNSFAIRSQGSTCALAAAAAYVPYVVAKLLQMMLLNYASHSRNLTTPRNPLISCVPAANCYFLGVARITKVYIELHASMHR